jgi:signal transduction histidine kinase
MHLPGKRLLNQLSIGGKLKLGFGLLIALTLLVVVLNILSSYRVTQEINRTSDVRMPAALAAAQAQASLQAMVADVHAYLALGSLGHLADYYAALQTFEANLAELERLAPVSSTPEQVHRLEALRTTFAEWLALSEKLYALHNNPRLNQPGLYLYRTEIQPLRTTILGNMGSLIHLQGQRRVSTENSNLLADMVNFQTSFDAMMINLRGYALAGDLSFRNEYMARLPLNTTAWTNLQAKRTLLTLAQQTRFDQIAEARAALAGLPTQIFDRVYGEHASEDLYLFRTVSAPQADQMLRLLSQMTIEQQHLLQTDLSAGRHSLANAQLQSLIGSLLVLLLGVSMAAIFRKTIVGPVRNLTETAERVASGDLHFHASVESGDEIGQLADTFNLMTGQLRQTITRLENQTRQLEALKQVAEAANLAKSEFIANMSHELRTPLNAILGYAQILGRDEKLNEPQAKAVNIIHSSGEHLLTLINDILDLSKIEAHKMELQPADFHLPGFLEVIISMFQIRAQQKGGITFTYEQVTQLPAIIHADEKRLRQILINLVGNAIKFTDRGEVIFRVGLIDPLSRVFITPKTEMLANMPCHIRFEVIDTGIGIQADKLEQIFLPFEQVSDPHHRAEGAGLGLTITKNLVEAMKGCLSVESELGRGSLFRLELELQVVLTRLEHPRASDWSDRESPFEASNSPEASPDHLVPPPPEEIAVLYDLAMKGELPHLRQRALQIEQMGEQYRAFTTRLCRRVEKYAEDEILALIERYVPKAPAHD